MDLHLVQEVQGVVAWDRLEAPEQLDKVMLVVQIQEVVSRERAAAVQDKSVKARQVQFQETAEMVSHMQLVEHPHFMQVVVAGVHFHRDLSVPVGLAEAVQQWLEVVRVGSEHQIPVEVGRVVHITEHFLEVEKEVQVLSSSVMP